MRDTNRGIICLLLNALFYSTSSLTFVKSGFQANQFLFWLGLFGTTFGISVLSLDRSFNLSAQIRDKQVYLSLLNAAVFGSAALYFHFWSLEYLLPADNNMVGVFFALLTAVILQSIEDKKCPTLLTVISVSLGITGTAFICDPITLLTQNIAQNTTLKGVIICAFDGVFLSLLYSNARKFDSITPCWSSFGFMFGNLIVGAVIVGSDVEPATCSVDLRILAASSALLQAVSILFANLGSSHTTVTALSVTQLLAPAINFTAQIFLFPDRFSWSSAVGIVFTVLAVLSQMVVLRKREKCEKIKSFSLELYYQPKHSL